MGRPSGVRAVARANGDNRIAIIIPCHRVIGSNGELVGYGGGLSRKRKLLGLEGRAGALSLFADGPTAARIGLLSRRVGGRPAPGPGREAAGPARASRAGERAAT